MYFRIERVGPGGAQERKGSSYATHPAPHRRDRKYPVVVHTFDDDGNFAYGFGCSCWDAAEDAFDFAMRDVGATYSTAGERGKPLTPFMG